MSEQNANEAREFEGDAAPSGADGPEAAAPAALKARHYEEAREAGLLLMRIDPKKIRATRFKNRSERSLLLHDAAFIRLTRSIAAQGQDTPIRVRPVAGADPFEFEIVAGHRRHAACLALDVARGGFGVIAMVDPQAIDPLDLVRKMFRENDLRENLSAYETGMMFRQWLEAGIFATHEAIARETGQSKQNVGKYLALAAIPEFLRMAFRDERSLSLRWSSELSRLAASAGEDLQALAADLSQRVPPLAPDAVFAELVRAGSKRGRYRPQMEAILDGDQPAFQLSGSRRRLALRMGKALKPREVRELRSDLKEWLERWLEKKRGR